MLLPFLLILALVIALTVSGTIVSMYIRSSAANRYKKRLRRLQVATPDGSENPLHSDARVANSEMSRYARTVIAAVLLLLALFILVITTVMNGILH